MGHPNRSGACQACSALASIALALALASPRTASADASSASALRITTAFAQAGLAEDAQAYVLGATWDWHWRSQTRWGVLTGYWESSIGQWRTRNSNEGTRSALVTQLGITPVLRLAPLESHPDLFLEVGIGANLLFPIYQTHDKQFSTAFNFGDHLAIGYRHGNREFALRLQHFSNAGIKHPNPGEDFIQLRYAFHY